MTASPAPSRPDSSSTSSPTPGAGKNPPLVVSFGYAFQGLAFVGRERNFRIQSTFGLIAVSGGAIFGLTPVEWMLVVLAIGGVLAAEAMNSALESIVDLVSPEHHPLAGKAKDMAAGGVLLVTVAAIVVGLVIFGPHAIALLAWAASR